jgi:putative DNA-invertase from lambdoid prophage Rac
LRVFSPNGYYLLLKALRSGHHEVTAKRAPKTAKTKRVFGQRQAPAKMFRVGLYARVSTHDQQTLPLQIRAMREYAVKRGWAIAVQIKEVGSGATERELRERLLAAARRREIDVVLVWRLDRWGRSLLDLVVTLKELAALGIGFVSLTEALDLTTPTGRAMAGLLSVFAQFENEILRERIRAGIAEARLQGKHLGRPVTVGKKASHIRKLHRAGVSKAEIARRLDISRTSVRRLVSEVQP